jgi:hypothetical protein
VCHTLRGFTSEDLEILCRSFSVQKMDAGKQLWVEGEMSTFFVVCIDGQLTLTRAREHMHGTEKMGVLNRGDFLDPAEYFERRPGKPAYHTGAGLASVSYVSPRISIPYLKLFGAGRSFGVAPPKSSFGSWWLCLE